MKAVILAGGMGTRLRPITYEIPKPLLPVKRRPIVNHLIDLFGRYGIVDIALLISRDHQNDFERWYKNWLEELSEKNIHLFYEEIPRGTFGGMEVVKSWLGNDDFILSNGDELKDFNLTALIDFHKTHQPLGTVALVEVPDAHEYGVPVMDGHHIRQFLEKPSHPPTNFINSGLSVLNPLVFDYVDFTKENIMYEKDIFPQLAASGKLIGHLFPQSRWYDCGNLERWERAIKEW
ncbi:MAG: nucleotidyltransferase family protein [Anaplasmataceae bacterium]|nr:nucleotidyltransferase family protein [Anaplasmataceae bacterium]